MVERWDERGALFALPGSDEVLARVRSLGRDVQASLEAELRTTLAALPLPAFPHAGGELLRHRTRIELLLGAVEAERGDDRRLVEAARRAWVNGGGHLAYLRVLLAAGRRDHALRLAMSLLLQRTDEHEAIDTLVADVLALSSPMRRAIDALTAAPTKDAFVALTRFFRGPEREDRLRYVATRLEGRGHAARVVFDLLVAAGPGEALADLVESGRVSPALVARRGADMPSADRAAFLGLAARAAAVRGAGFEAVRYLCEARSSGRDRASLVADVTLVRAHAEPWVHRALSSSGFDVGLPEA